jgi:hypothetical protein
MTEEYEDPEFLDNDDETKLFQWCLRHWVRRNSFVGMHAEYIAKIEDISGDPIDAWRLCMATYSGASCPELAVWREAIQHMSTHTNSGENLPVRLNSSFTKTWDDLAATSDRDRDYVAIALKLAENFGYEPEAEQTAKYGLATLKFTCGFEGEGEARSTGGKTRYWDCEIDLNK